MRQAEVVRGACEHAEDAKQTIQLAEQGAEKQESDVIGRLSRPGLLSLRLEVRGDNVNAEDDLDDDETDYEHGV